MLCLEMASLKHEGMISIKEDLVNSTGKWITADDGSQYLRELEALEAIYSKLKCDNVPKDPEDAPCTMTMWRKVAQSTQEAPSYWCPIIVVRK